MNIKPRRPIEINPLALRAAQLCQGKNDVRYYLNGVCLAKDNQIHGSNGHILFTVETENDMKLKNDWILQFESAIPKSARSGFLHFQSNKGGYLEWFPRQLGFTNRAKKPEAKHIHFKVIDGKFPDVADVARRSGANSFDGNNRMLGINACYLSVIEKAFAVGANSRYPSVKMIHNGSKNVAIFEPHGPDTLELFGVDPKIYIMPMRLPEDN